MPIHEMAVLAESQHGVVGRAQLRGLGIGRSEIAHAVASGQWQPVTDEVLRRVGSPRTTGQFLAAAVVDAGSDAVLSHTTAARWWGLEGCALRPVHVSRTSPSRRRTNLAVLHRVRDLPASWTTTLDEVRVVRPELLALQLFAISRPARAERLVDHLWSMRLLSGASIGRLIDDLGKRGRNGTAGIRAYLEPRGPDYIPPATGVESRFMELIGEHGIPMKRQVDSGGEQWTGRVDFRHLRLPLIVEIQSERHHTALVDVEADRVRIAQLEADGFVVVPITDVMLFADPAQVVRRVRSGIVAAGPDRT